MQCQVMKRADLARNIRRFSTIPPKKGRFHDALRITDMRSRHKRTPPRQLYRRKRPMRIAIADDRAPDAKTLEDADPLPSDKGTHLRAMPPNGDDLFEATDAPAFDLAPWTSSWTWR